MENQTVKELRPEPGILFLTGFMGSGKSHAGSLLAERLAVPFVDLDDLVERLSAQSVATLFERYGEPNFRIIESRTLRCLLGSPVVATGGGAPCFYGGMDYMNTVGTTVFLDPSEDILLDRLKAGRSHRPLLQRDEDLRNLIQTGLRNRRAIYERAQIHLAYDDPAFDVVGALLAEFNRRR